MEPRATIMRSRDGSERVIVELADFQALLDAAQAADHGLPAVVPIVRELARVLAERRNDTVDLEEFLAEYDATHGES
jgi:hypothetical protein